MLAKAKGFVSSEAGATDGCEPSDVAKAGVSRRADYFLYFYWGIFLITLLYSSVFLS